MIIGLCGYKGSGKTTVAETAINLHRGPVRYSRIGFADPMLDMMQALGIPRETLNDKTRWNSPLPLLCGRTIRHAMQTLGTEWGRDTIDNDLWSNIALARADEIGGCVIIDNVRFPSEADAILKRGGRLIAFCRTDGATGASHHASESYIGALQHDYCRYQFLNPGNDLEHVAGSFFEYLEFVRAST